MNSGIVIIIVGGSKIHASPCVNIYLLLLSVDQSSSHPLNVILSFLSFIGVTMFTAKHWILITKLYTHFHGFENKNNKITPVVVLCEIIP